MMDTLNDMSQTFCSSITGAFVLNSEACESTDRTSIEAIGLAWENEAEAITEAGLAVIL